MGRPKGSRNKKTRAGIADEGGWELVPGQRDRWVPGRAEAAAIRAASLRQGQRPGKYADKAKRKTVSRYLNPNEEAVVDAALAILRENEKAVSILAILRSNGVYIGLQPDGSGDLAVARADSDMQNRIRANKDVIINALKAERELADRAEAFGAGRGTLVPYEYSAQAGAVRRAYEWASKCADDGSGDKDACLEMIALLDRWVNSMSHSYLLLPQDVASWLKIRPEFIGILVRINESRKELEGAELRQEVDGLLGKRAKVEVKL